VITVTAAAAQALIVATATAAMATVAMMVMVPALLAQPQPLVWFAQLRVAQVRAEAVEQSGALQALPALREQLAL
jgi:hypothetical protein